GLGNQAWRVREMCAKVVLLRDLQVAPKLVRLTTDENPRVRAAALHALAAQGTDEHVETIAQRLRDPEKSVRQAAQQARDVLRERLRPATGSDASADTVDAVEAE
ncbi:MAG: HEAT repeat domain-containing protein, partial [Microterricola sp.]